MKYLILFFFTSLCSAQSKDYTYLSTTKNVEFHYKFENYFEDLQYVTFWLKTINKELPRKNKNGKLIYPKAYYTITHMTIYCSNNTYGQDDYITYDRKGNIITSGNKGIFNDKIFPDTIAESLKNELCK